MTPSLGRTKNPHDIFINLDGSVEMAVQSKKPKAVVVVKWLTKKGIENIQETINKPSKKKMQHLHCLLLTYKTVTIKFKPLSMRTLHCQHKKMCIRLSYKNVKTPSPILKHVIFLMREILVKTTLSSTHNIYQR